MKSHSDSKRILCFVFVRGSTDTEATTSGCPRHLAQKYEVQTGVQGFLVVRLLYNLLNWSKLRRNLGEIKQPYCKMSKIKLYFFQIRSIFSKYKSEWKRWFRWKAGRVFAETIFILHLCESIYWDIDEEDN